MKFIMHLIAVTVIVERMTLIVIILMHLFLIAITKTKFVYNLMEPALHFIPMFLMIGPAQVKTMTLAMAVIVIVAPTILIVYHKTKYLIALVPT